MAFSNGASGLRDTLLLDSCIYCQCIDIMITLVDGHILKRENDLALQNCIIMIDSMG